MGLVCAYNPIPLTVKIKSNDDVNASLAIVSIFTNFDEYIIYKVTLFKRVVLLVSFPPRPWTSHVRWIESDVNIPDYVFVAIEAGALVQSRDGGRTWIDRVEQGPYDTHTLGTHQKAPKRLFCRRRIF